MSESKAAIAAFAIHQQRSDIHPLTCGNDSRHRVLVLREDGMLACPDCDYVQEPHWKITPTPGVPHAHEEKE